MQKQQQSSFYDLPSRLPRGKQPKSESQQLRIQLNSNTSIPKEHKNNEEQINDDAFNTCSQIDAETDKEKSTKYIKSLYDCLRWPESSNENNGALVQPNINSAAPLYYIFKQS